MPKTPPLTYDEPAEAQPETNDLFGPEPEESGDPQRRQDEELKVIALILRTLGRVDPKARGRIMTYLTARFCQE
jgi:hypothetical protein